MSIGLSERAGAIAGSATMAVSSRAAELRAAGHRIVSFGAGEPDFPTPGHIVEAAQRACGDPVNHRYTSAAGLPELRRAVAETILADTGLTVADGDILVTNGAKQAVYLACMVLLDGGDEALIPAPYWTTYPEAVRLAGATPVTVHTGDRTDYKVTPELLDAHVSPRTKVLFFGSPANPTGTVYTPEETRAIGVWAARRGIWVISDEIYQHLVYDGAVARSMPAAAPEVAGRCLVIGGVSKTYGMTGWRVGWIYGPTAAIKAAVNFQSHMSSNVTNVAQVAAICALRNGRPGFDGVLAAYDRRRRLMVNVLQGIRGVDCPTPQGAFYCFPSVKRLLTKSILGHSFANTAELATFILDEASVALLPGEAFGAPGCLRLSYALDDQSLQTGLERLQRLLSSQDLPRAHVH
ncbi:pyridoxal phosphate-dependent aminotransferase [Spongiactinospora sp. TRM90649]|uniref:pyridoxal phosphate-dependent aminotransferase n=1 Tax=Spongiactinospora sp. TRM90649 TaxID=3031114 RepID=UPI0023FA32DE|nr:pyridoxal phosphate-dependent aminotransferase [Spongiactinospora sp. TRM90649]MDF5751077.1 pyridoxal phosphate-dependent aminotransferase [Spongiactinospora sp. TRM90649]